MKTIVLALLCAFLSIPLFAQLSVGTFFNHHQGLSSFGKNVDSRPQGLSVLALYRLPDVSWSLGVEVGQSVYNDRRYGYTFKDDEWGWVTTDVKEVQTMTRVNLISRYHFFDDAALEPYAAGRFGVLTFATARCVDDARSIETGTAVMDERDVKEHLQTIENHGTSLQLSLGLGTVVNLKRLICETVKDYGFELKLDAGVFYSFGSNTAYSGGSNELNQSVTHLSAIHDLNVRAGILVAF